MYYNDIKIRSCTLCARVPQPLFQAAALASGHYIHSESPGRWGLVLWQHLHHELLIASSLREVKKRSVIKKQQSCCQTEHFHPTWCAAALRFLSGIKVMIKPSSSKVPSLRSFLNTRTFSIFPSSAPSSAGTHTDTHRAVMFICIFTLMMLALFACVHTTHDYHCSHQPEWSLWPSEVDFSSGH